MDVRQALRMLTMRVDAMITRAVIGRVNDALKTQRFQLEILADEIVDDVEHMQPYGLSFVPPDGAEAVALSVSGSRGHTIAICAQHPDERPKGKTARTGGLYTKGEWRLFVDADGVVHIGAETGADFPALAGKVRDQLVVLKDAIDSAGTTAQDGGAAFKAALLLKLAGWPESVAASKTKLT